MKKICIITTDAGECHRAIERALKKILGIHQYSFSSYEIYKVILKRYDIVNLTFGISGSDFYNEQILKRGKSVFVWLVLGGIALLILFFKKKSITQTLTRFFSERKPDLIISLIPFFNDALINSTKVLVNKTPVLTIMVDHSETIRNTWFQNKSQLVAVFTDKAHQQARQAGILSKQILRLSGGIISPDFYTNGKNHQSDIEELKSKLSKDYITLLLMFGGYGSKRIFRYACILEKAKLPIQCIYVCGRNERLSDKIRNIYSTRPKLIFDYIENVVPFYSVADIFVGKPGPGVINEAIKMNKPVLVELNFRTLIQERYNAHWVLENQVGLTFRSGRSLIKKIDLILKNNLLPALIANTKKLDNRGIFEIKEIINKVLSGEL